jgi:hypothetical protein
VYNVYAIRNFLFAIRQLKVNDSDASAVRFCIDDRY